MKFIDEKGRFFGVLNIIDLLIILLVLGAIAGIFAKTSVLKRINRNFTEVPARMQLIVENVRQTTADAVKPGDIIKEVRSGEQLGVVKEVKVEDYKEKAADSQGNWHMSPVPDKKTIFITLEGNLKSYNNEFRAGQTDIKIGSKVNVKSNMYTFEGYILKIETIKQGNGK
ncbi:DUF4330 domain-containing protein [Desulfofundulus thermobenzoicus]|nr:DUF4330 domain-containing protein [Desulfofundulus thermobenzoicus]